MKRTVKFQYAQGCALHGQQLQFSHSLIYRSAGSLECIYTDISAILFLDIPQKMSMSGAHKVEKDKYSTRTARRGGRMKESDKSILGCKAVSYDDVLRLVRGVFSGCGDRCADNNHRKDEY